MNTVILQILSSLYLTPHQDNKDKQETITELSLLITIDMQD
jgi:hypothetical protein